VVTPVFGDQPFWGQRVAALGAGPAPLPLRRLTAERLAEAIDRAVADPRLRAAAAAAGERLRAEDGVGAAVEAIARHAPVRERDAP
jgi:UDP:flavonoid glycosyltransferase YjiC (YdhE family)